MGIDHEMDAYLQYEADDSNLDGSDVRNDPNNIFNLLVIKKDSTWKGAFDIIMLIVSCYNIFGNALYSAFGLSD